MAAARDRNLRPDPVQLPRRIIADRPIIGSSAQENAVLKHAVPADREALLSDRSLNTARNLPTHLMIPVPVSTPDTIMTALIDSFPHSDFARTFSNQPHAIAVAARRAAIESILANINSTVQATRLTLVGPSGSQVRKFQLAFPFSSISVFQPLVTGRDQARWAPFHSITHPVYWNESTCIPSDVIVAPLSVGAFHPADFARAMIASGAHTAYVLHHWSAAGLIVPTTDGLTEMSFRPDGDRLHCTFPDSPAYTDSVSAARAWLTGDITAVGHSFAIDELLVFGSLRLIKIQRGVGVNTSQPTMRLFDDQRYLPACGSYKARLVPAQILSKVNDYLGRQNDVAVTTIVARNRIAALAHRVAIGNAVIQDAIIIDDESAGHIAEVCVRETMIRRALAQAEQRRLAKALEVADANFVEKALVRVDGRIGSVLFAAEAASRIVINSWALPINLLRGAPLKAVDFTPVTGSTVATTTNSGFARFIGSTIEDDLRLYTQTATDRLRQAPVHLPLYRRRISALSARLYYLFSRAGINYLSILLNHSPSAFRTYVIDYVTPLVHVDPTQNSEIICLLNELRLLLHQDRNLADACLDLLNRLAGFAGFVALRGLAIAELLAYAPLALLFALFGGAQLVRPPVAPFAPPINHGAGGAPDDDDNDDDNDQPRPPRPHSPASTLHLSPLHPHEISLPSSRSVTPVLQPVAIVPLAPVPAAAPVVAEVGEDDVIVAPIRLPQPAALQEEAVEPPVDSNRLVVPNLFEHQGHLMARNDELALASLALEAEIQHELDIIPIQPPPPVDRNVATGQVELLAPFSQGTFENDLDNNATILPLSTLTFSSSLGSRTCWIAPLLLMRLLVLELSDGLLHMGCCIVARPTRRLLWSSKGSAFVMRLSSGVDLVPPRKARLSRLNNSLIARLLSLLAKLNFACLTSPSMVYQLLPKAPFSPRCSPAKT